MIRPGTARLPRRFASRNDKSGGFAPLNFCRDHCQLARRSLTAATDAIGVCHFNDSRYKSAVGAPPISHKNIPDAAASGISLSKKSFQTFSPNCFQNCKIIFCSTILQFCRCGGLWNAKGNPDGFLSHFPSLRNFRLSRFLTVCTALPVRFRQRGFSHSMDLRDSAMEMRSILRMRHRHTATASSSVAAKASA